VLKDERMRTHLPSPENLVLSPHERMPMYWLAVELHGFFLDHIPARRRGDTVRGQLDRATYRAAVNIGLAAGAPKKRAEVLLGRAREALAMSLMALDALAIERRLSIGAYAEGRRWIARVLAGIAALAAAPVETWPDIPAPPAAPDSATVEETDPVVEHVKASLERLSVLFERARAQALGVEPATHASSA
jgi:hypothetical protein